MLEWHDRILELVNKPNYRPVKPRVLAKVLDVPREEAQDFKRFVKKMVKRGELAYGEKHLVYPPGGVPARVAKVSKEEKTTARAAHISGTFHRTSGGYGFVRPAGTSVASDRSQDFYIAPEHTLDAADGDLVLVRPMKQKERFRGYRAQIVEILERQTRQFVGTYFETAGVAYVQIDGTLFKQPIPVGDPGAKSAKPDDKVVIEMIRFPTHTRDGEGVITQVLGTRGEPGVDTQSIIHEFNLPEEFSQASLDVARAAADAFSETIPPERLDLTNETIITIDPVTARDFDDAISLVQIEKGHWLLGVHIADVAHFVRVGSALDREAYQRGTSVYLPDRVIPMLPEVISNGLASLQPDRIRYTKTAFIEFTPEGVVCNVELRNTVIRSCRRFTYEEVDEYLAGPDAWRTKLSPEVHALVGLMHELAMILRGRRLAKGALELTMRDVKIDLDADGRVTGAHREVNTVSHQIIEEFMLAANMAVAETLFKNEVPFLRRVHQPPNPLKLQALTEFVHELGYKTESLESRFELQRLLKLVADQPTAPAVNYAVLRSLARAVYSPEEEGHYALASDCYCHFTSPIRRYPDLTIHRLFDALVQGRKPKGSVEELMVIGEHCSQRERRAESAERELTKVKLLHYLEERVGLELEAVITGVEQFGLFAQGVDLPAEGLIQVSSLADDFYQFDKRTHSLTGRRSGNTFRLGDPIVIQVARVDVERREMDFRLVKREKRSEKKAASAEKPEKKAASSEKGKRAKSRPPAGKKATRRKKNPE
jgi:ribonuclease R